MKAVFRIIVTSTVAAAAALIAAPAMAQNQTGPAARSADTAPGAKSGECLRIRNIWDFTPVPGNRALIVTDLARRKYKVTFNGPCLGLQYHTGLKFHSRGTGGLSCMTRGDSVITHDISGQPVCLISSVVPYTAQMEKADAKAQAKAKKAEQAGKDR